MWGQQILSKFGNVESVLLYGQNMLQKKIWSGILTSPRPKFFYFNFCVVIFSSDFITERIAPNGQLECPLRGRRMPCERVAYAGGYPYRRGSESR